WSNNPDALAGIFGKTWSYADPNNSPAEKAFVQQYRAKEGKPPSDRVFFGWHGMRLLLAALEDGKSADPVAVTKALAGLKLQDGGLPLSFRSWDHQLTRRLVVASARSNPKDKWDILDVKASRPANAAELERLYGTPAEVGCRM